VGKSQSSVSRDQITSFDRIIIGRKCHVPLWVVVADIVPQGSTPCRGQRGWTRRASWPRAGGVSRDRTLVSIRRTTTAAIRGQVCHRGRSGGITRPFVIPIYSFVRCRYDLEPQTTAPTALHLHMPPATCHLPHSTSINHPGQARCDSRLISLDLGPALQVSPSDPNLPGLQTLSASTKQLRLRNSSQFHIPCV